MANFNTHTLENKFLLYHHINPISNEIFYVGIGDSKRPFEQSGRSKWWNRTVTKYGIIVKIIFSNLTWKKACELEIKHIKELGRRDKGLGTLVNMTDGGDGSAGCYPSIETKIKMSNSQKKVDRSSMPQHKKGRKLSISHTRKDFYKSINRPYSPQLDENQNIIREWKSLKETALELNEYGPKICAILKGRLRNKYNIQYK